MSDDLFIEPRPDGDKPVTRNELRMFARSIRGDLKWLAAVSVIGNQALNHVPPLPPAVGITGTVVTVGAFLLKGVIGRHG